MKNVIKVIAVVFLTLITTVPYGNLIQEERIDYVPNKETAIKIAEAIWLPIYGDEIYEKKPFVARLKNAKVWIVEGTLEKEEVGGVPYIEIQKKDCKILKVYHGK
jgi:hypothetical protein